MIALCLVLNPPFVIFDEATSSLDTVTQRGLLDELRRLQRELGMAVLLIAHDLAVAAEYTDRVAVMHAGRIVEAGPTAEVLSNPRHDYTQMLRGAALALEPADLTIAEACRRSYERGEASHQTRRCWPRPIYAAATAATPAPSMASVWRSGRPRSSRWWARAAAANRLWRGCWLGWSQSDGGRIVCGRA